MRGAHYSIGALSVLGVLGVSAQDYAPCVDGCVGGTRGKFADFGCTAADETGCLCVNDNFKYSVRDCSIATCQANEEQALDLLYGTFCQAFAPVESDAPSTTAVESTTGVPTTTEPASTEAEETSPTTTATEEKVSTTEASTAEASTTEVPSTTEGPLSTPNSGTDSATATETTTGATSTTDAEPTATSGADRDRTEEDGDEGSGGLSQGAKVGIGVGVAVIVVAIAVVAAVFLLRRKRNQQPNGQSADSRPIPPSAGRSYPSADHGPGLYIEKGRGGESIEMQSNRYEDMPPSETPRVMV